MTTAWSISAILGAATVVLEAYAIVLAVTRTKGVDRTLAWVFGILAVPGIGAVAYLLLASPSIKRTARRKQQSAQCIRCQVERDGGDARVPEAVRGASPLVGSVLELARQLTGQPATPGNQAELLVDNDRAFEHLRRAIKGAKKQIWAEYYLIRNDETGHRFLELLAEKAAEGIEVRLLYDAVGSVGLDAKRLRAIVRAGGKAEVFLPLNPLRRRWAVHLRNHRKMIIVDGALGFTGGMNVGDEYSGRARRRGKQQFRDTHLALRGPAVGDLAQTFAEDWAFATDEELTLPPAPAPLGDGHALVAIVPSGPDQQFNANGFTYFAAIAAARESVYLTSPYFVPDEPTLQALASAAMRGVDVRVLVPERPDVAMVGPAARSFFPRLVRAGVRVFEYRAMLHAKTMLVDGAWGIVGSANVDIRSFRLNFELSALVVDHAMAAEMRERFMGDLEQSREVTREMVDAYGALFRFGNGLARLLSPLL